MKKALGKVSPWTLREVDRLNENPEKGMANADSEDLSSLLFNLIHIINSNNSKYSIFKI